MAELEPLSPDLIRRYLDADDAEYEVDEDGVFTFEYDPDPDSGRTLTVNLSIVEQNWYFIQITSDQTFQRPEWERAVWLCNRWNAKEMYPAAYLLEDPDHPEEADIFLDYTAIFTFGVSQEQIEDITEKVIGSAFEFWEWARREQGI